MCIPERSKNIKSVLKVSRLSEYSKVQDEDAMLIMTDCLKDSVILSMDNSTVYLNKSDIARVAEKKMFLIKNFGKKAVTIFVIRDSE
jgi:hypothetical protein